MSVTATPLTVHTPTPKASWIRRARPYLVFLFCTSLYLFPFMRLLLEGSDEGLLVSGAVRVAEGQVFARDFFEIVGPGTFYWLALFFKIFGVSFFAERLCLFVTSIGTALLIYFLSRKVCGQYQTLPALVLAGTYFGVIWPTISHHVDSNFFALVSIALAVLWQHNRKKPFLLVAGIAVGLTTCFHQPKGILLILAFLVWLWIRRESPAEPVSSIVLLTGGFLAPIVLMALYFWHQHALWDLIYANYIWPSKHYAAANIVVYGQGIFRDYWNSWAIPTGTIRWMAVTASVLVIPFLYVATLPILLPVLALWITRTSQKPEILLFWLCGCSMWLSEYHRKDICHLVFGSPLLIVLGIYYLQQLETTLARLALQLLAIASVSLACLNLFMALSAHPIATRVGTVTVFKSDPTLAFLQDQVAAGTEIFVYPDAPIYYYLTATTNPTRWSGIGYNYNVPADFREVVNTLEQRHVRYVVWDTLLEDRALKFFFSMKRARPEERIIEPYFESHYRVIWEQNGVRIMERM